MTVATTQSSVTYAGNGSSTVFPFAFEIPQSGEEQVTLVSATGVSTLLTSSQYAVSGFGSPTGGSVVYPIAGSPIASGTTLTIARVLPFVQSTSFSNQGAYLPSATEQAFDYATWLLQQLSDNLALAITAPITDSGVTMKLPPAVARAGGYLGFDSFGNVAIVAGAPIDSATLAAFFATLPTTLPASSGVVWNNGGVVCIS